jgi:hypothetical protein
VSCPGNDVFGPPGQGQNQGTTRGQPCGSNQLAVVACPGNRIRNLTMTPDCARHCACGGLPVPRPRSLDASPMGDLFSFFIYYSRVSHIAIRVRPTAIPHPPSAYVPHGPGTRLAGGSFSINHRRVQVLCLASWLVARGSLTFACIVRAAPAAVLPCPGPCAYRHTRSA